MKYLIWRNFCKKIVGEKFANFHTVQCHSVEKREILSHRKKISWNQLFSNFFSETVTFTKFLPKKRESKFPKFAHCLEKWKIYSHRKKISSNQLISNSFSKTVTFTRFLPKMCESEFPQYVCWEIISYIKFVKSTDLVLIILVIVFPSFLFQDKPKF